MKIFKSKIATGLMIIILSTVFTISSVFAQQVKYIAKDNLNLVIRGTSTLHDWDMKGSQGEVDAVFNFNSANQVTALNSLSFTCSAKSIKSTHGSMMDNKAYSAIKADKNANITFTATSATLTGNTIKALGKLTIAGVTREAEIDATYKVNADKSISINGSEKVTLKDFDVTPPTVMFMKVGPQVTITFTLTLKK